MISLMLHNTSYNDSLKTTKKILLIILQLKSQTTVLNIFSLDTVVTFILNVVCTL